MESPERVNLVSDRISFVNKISTLIKATSDDDKPIAGYLYKEISDISLESAGYCESLVEYLVDRLEKNSYHVKLKVLKLMKYTVDNGHPNFKLGLMKMGRGVRAATKYGGPPDTMHGNVPYVLIRKTAQELCEVLFDVEEPGSMTSGEATQHQSQPPPPKQMVGIGPSNTSGKMEGFGNITTNPQKSIGETIIDGITKIAEKMSESESDRQRAVLAALDGGSGSYQPPVIVAPEPISVDNTSTQPTRSPLRKSPPKHIPGRAGGGWEDEPEASTEPGQRQSDSGGSSDLADRLESVTVADWSTEENLVTSIVENSEQLLRQSQLSAFQRKCSGLNSEKVLEFIVTRLTSDREEVVMKCLLLLETYLRSDLVNLEYLVTSSKTGLVSVYNQWIGPPKSKARKVIRILEKLTSHKSILPAANTESNVECASLVMITSDQAGGNTVTGTNSDHTMFSYSGSSDMDMNSILNTNDAIS